MIALVRTRLPRRPVRRLVRRSFSEGGSLGEGGSPGRRRAALLCFVLCLCASALPARAQTAPPVLTAPVNDFANAIDAGAKQQLESLIRQLQSASGDVMVVATVKTYQPWADLKSYAVEMFKIGGKGVGTKGKDNGVLIVLALDDRQVWIESGYGLEGFVTDGFAGETSRGMVPFFREGDYGRGLLAGATIVAQRVAQGRNVNLDLAPIQAPRAEPRSYRGGGFPVGLIVVLIIIFLNMMGGGGRGMRRGGRWVSGVGPFGGGFGGGGSWGGGGGFGGGFGGGRSGGGGGGAGW